VKTVAFALLLNADGRKYTEIVCFYTTVSLRVVRSRPLTGYVHHQRHHTEMQFLFDNVRNLLCFGIIDFVRADVSTIGEQQR